ncbi:hypothetical protein KC095_01910 [Acinetobacter nosocomialis]|uniref:crAss001_48 related protein n=1 Tax=Acinetobacter nosocomialis TaxID=106654 RepID=UPI001B81FE42|nr:hypothetical protein [Acinetobacter nosocomialis]MBR7723736.1 hypothetical protein [Acinetobacter nosocomialis]
MSGKELQPHEQRVIEEKDQLNERLHKLQEFLDKGQPKFIDDQNWGLLQAQFSAMAEYYVILMKRIELF